VAQWLESVCVTRVSSAGEDPAKWQLTSIWEESGGHATVVAAKSVYASGLLSLVDGLLSEMWGPLDMLLWIDTH
jgi:hypothetical protein